jgi:hypothetical protein
MSHVEEQKSTASPVLEAEYRQVEEDELVDLGSPKSTARSASVGIYETSIRFVSGQGDDRTFIRVVIDTEELERRNKIAQLNKNLNGRE